MVKYYITFLLACICYSGFAQEQPGLQEMADRHFYRYNYSMAAPLYESIAKKKNPRPSNYYKLAYCYDEMQQYEKALEYYNLYLANEAEDNRHVLIRVGDINKTLHRYEEAKKAYGSYNTRNIDTTRILTNKIAGCDSAIAWAKEKEKFAVSNQWNLNSALSDWGAAFYADKKVVFTSEDKKVSVLAKKSRGKKKKYGWTGNPYLRLYTSATEKMTPADTMAISDFGKFANSNLYHVGPAAFTKNYDTVYFTVTNGGKNLEKERIAKQRDIKQRNLKLMVSYKDGTGNWIKPIDFPYNKPEEYSLGHAALSKDGKYIYFTSDMYGSEGKTDIWYCEKSVDGRWQNPRNCGKLINTPEEEAFPTIGPKNELYFASTGHPGMGGFDIFSVVGTENKWKDLQNMHNPLNSTYDDFYMSMNDSLAGYISSNRPGGKGSDDIYSFKAIPRIRNYVLKAILCRKKDSSRIEGGNINLNLMPNLPPVTKLSDMQGVAYFPLEKLKKYKLKGSYVNFNSDSLYLATEDAGESDTLVRYLYLEKFVPYSVGETFVLEDLYYDYDKYYIRPDAAKVLDELVAILNKYPTLEIELSSHTDSRGSDPYNMLLSQRRAESAVKYIISTGISAGRIRAQGYGETKLKNRCSNGVKCSEPEHQLNRRTEVKVLKV
jgi:outer membrane protein OmpA-like peptidoglycan-associated protein/tetratricopeptide (TPR) repeat protein